MTNSFLKGYKWSEISRDERYYCAHLFQLMNNNQEKTITWIRDNLYGEMNLDKSWEIGYEVCFYRDYFHWFKKDESIKTSIYPEKRTFDLVLFSDDEIIIIEAKAHEIFKQKQVDDIKEDKDLIAKLSDHQVNVKCFALASSKYFDNSKKFNKEWLNKDIFDNSFTWKQMAKLFDEDTLLKRANFLRYEKDIDELKRITAK